MGLTHVSYWTEHGWKKITAEEAEIIFPRGTVSARSGFFMCDLCNQCVTLTGGSIYRRHFRHSTAEADKDCLDRTQSYQALNSFEAGKHFLPLRLQIDSPREFHLEIGLIPLPKNIRDSCKEGKIYISSNTQAAKTYE